MAGPLYQTNSLSSFATAANITAAEPSGAASGDILRADLYIESTTAVTAPSGWSNSFNGTTAVLTNSTATGSSTAYKHYAYWIRRGASAPALTWTFTSSFRAILVQRFSGALASGDPWSFCNPTQRDDNVDKSWPSASGTTLDANELLTWVGLGSNVGGAGTQPTGFTERVDASTGLESADLAQAAAGGTGTVTGASYAGGAIASTSVILAGLRPAAGGTGYTVSLTDNLGLSDSKSTLSALKRVYSDNLGVNDLISRVAPSFRAKSDNLGLTDSELTRTFSSRSNPDNLGIADIESTKTESKRVSADNLGVSDLESTTTNSSRVNTDNLGLNDSKSTTSSSNRASIDNLGLSDSVARKGISSRASTDNLGMSDSVSRLVVSLRSLLDNLGITDLTTIFGPGGHTYLLSVIDSLGLSDSKQTSSSVSRLQTDSIGAADSLLQVTSSLRSLQDPIGAQDSTKRVSALMRLLQDSLGTQDIIARAVSTLLKIADNLGLTDNGRLTKIIPIVPTIFLTGNGQRNIAGDGEGQRNVAPTGAGQRNMMLSASAEVGP